MNPSFNFKAKVFLWDAHQASWHFVRLPAKLSKEIKGFYEGPQRGFGSIRVEVTIGKTAFKTSIFPEKAGTYVLPLKKAVRKAEGIENGATISVKIELL